MSGAGYIPENLSCLSNLAIAIVRLEGQFPFLPEALRYYASRPEESFKLIQKRFVLSGDNDFPYFSCQISCAVAKDAEAVPLRQTRAVTPEKKNIEKPLG